MYFTSVISLLLRRRPRSVNLGVSRMKQVSLSSSGEEAAAAAMELRIKVETRNVRKRGIMGLEHV